MTPPHPHAEYRRCLAEVDVASFRRLLHELFPHLPQPEDNAQALHTLHMARAQARSMPLDLRRYSQAWLDEHERRTVAYAVGIAVGAPEERQDMAEDLTEAMSSSVMNAY